MKSWFGIAALGLVVLIAACGGDNDSDESNLREYFGRLQTLTDEVRDRAATTVADPTNLDPSDPATFDNIASVFDESLDIYRDFVDDVRDLNPPNEARDAHDTLIDTLDAFLGSNEELIDQIENADTEAAFSAIFANAAADIEVVPVDAACGNLQQVAADNNISVNLDCGDDG